MNNHFNWEFPYVSRRMPILAKNIVATSQPLASQAGVEMLKKGGNAVDAALGTAIALTVVEPVSNGIGSDAFALLWDGKELVGLNGSGRSPAAWTWEYFSKKRMMPLTGWDTITVPGAVSAWVELWRKYGQLSFQELFEPAIKYARNGFLISPIVGEVWQYLAKMYKKKKFPEFWDAFMPGDKPPKLGELFKHPNQAKTLELIAKSEGEEFYNGELAKIIVEHAKSTGGMITHEDLENHRADWVKPLKINYNDITLHEIPPNGQGLTALIMLGILKNYAISQYEVDSVQSLHFQIEAMKLAFADAYRYFSDPSTMDIKPEDLLNESYLKKRANLINADQAQKYDFGIPKHNDTVYLTTADENGMMVSYIQSNYMGFGSGIVIPETGISLQNRGNGFNLIEGHPNQVGPNKRPFHTIIPAFVTKKGNPLMSFGVMGGQMQPQGHTQIIIRIFKYNQNPQAALDAPRWRVMQGLKVNLESGFEKEIYNQLPKLGHQVNKDHYFNFGGGQIIYKLDEGYLAASDSRKDGQAIGY
ncbi:MAG: gamma-glutamyltransferase [Candidatus Hodarchaeota archaeon]